MPRAAGDGSHYTFGLVNAKGEVVDLPQYKLELPSVSHIMDTALAGKTEPLKYWAYNHALAGALKVAEEWNPEEWASVDALKQAMKDRGFTLWRVMEDAKERGQNVHGFFEALMEGRIEFGQVTQKAGLSENLVVSEEVRGRIEVINDPADPDLRWRVATPEEHPTVPLPPEVEKEWQPLDPFMVGAMRWFLDNDFYGSLKSVRDLTVTERPVWSLNAVQPYAGTMDLMMPRTLNVTKMGLSGPGILTMTDLKTSGNKTVKERRIYDENKIQLTAYSRATEETTGLAPVAHSILVVDFEGGFKETFVNLKPRIWDALLNTYAAMQAEKGA